VDFLNYLRAYDGKRTICKPLADQLSKYDFSEIRAALVGSVPGKQPTESDSPTQWGWPGLTQALSSVQVQGNESEIVVQISSIATLGAKDDWLDKTLFKALGKSKNEMKKPKFKIIFPTADEIRRSLNGYASGSAIHTKIQSAQQQKQLHYMKPLFCHWAGDGAQHAEKPQPTHDAGRKRAAPHIKTYTRFSDCSRSTIDWMLVTSANLSKQAWGEARNSAGDIRVCSYELGVLVWPALFGEKATMVPTFKTDTPTINAVKPVADLIVGARMPYDFPLVPYAKGDDPWVATASYTRLDWKGETWNAG
jgi:tyrosyl-DNA phosphodiesterase-1